MYLSRGQRKSAPSYIIKVVYLIPPPCFSEFTSFDIFLFSILRSTEKDYKLIHLDFIMSVLTLSYVLLIIFIIILI